MASQGQWWKINLLAAHALTLNDVHVWVEVLHVNMVEPRLLKAPLFWPLISFKADFDSVSVPCQVHSSESHVSSLCWWVMRESMLLWESESDVRVVGGKIIRQWLRQVLPGLMYARFIPASVSVLLSLRVTGPADAAGVYSAQVAAVTRDCRCVCVFVFSIPALT